MLFCQSGQARSLREICGGLASCEGKLKHLGVPQAPNKSTLAYANGHRPWLLYQKVFGILFARCQQVAGTGHRFRFRNPLLSGHHYRQTAQFRRVEVWLEDRQEVLVLFRNHLDFGSTTIAQIYRERWRIEVFFCYLKQNLRIKTFVGTSGNALHIQIWTALIAMLLLKYLQLRARYGWSLSNLVALLRRQLFVYRDLQAWLDTPFEAPPLGRLARRPTSTAISARRVGQHQPNLNRQTHSVHILTLLRPTPV